LHPVGDLFEQLLSV